MSVQILLRRGTASAWTTANPTLAQGELAMETDTLKFKVGDGSTAWNSLSYFTQGANGQGVPTGGTTGQILKKNSSTNYDTSWFTLAKSDIGLGSVENTALSTWAGTSNITTLGTVTTGTWNATVIADGKIATALTGKTYNGINPTALTTGFTLAGGSTTSKTLTVNNTLGLSGTDGSTLNIGSGGTLGSNAFTSTSYIPTSVMTTAGDIIYGGTSGTATRLAGSATNGWVLTYDTSLNAPKWAAAPSSSGVTSVSATAPVVSSGGTTPTISLTTSGASSVVVRDANQNIQVNNIQKGFTSVTSAGTTTTLTASSSYHQRITGTSAQTIQFPDATTLANGHTFLIDNDSTGTVTVNDNSVTLVDAVSPGAVGYFFLEDNSTAAGSWGKYAYIPGTNDWGSTSLNLASGLTTIQGGSSGTTSNALTIQTGNVTGAAQTDTTGSLTIKTGNATDVASGFATSGNLIMDVGSVSTSGGSTNVGSITLGTTNATSITIGKSGGTTTVNSGISIGASAGTIAPLKFTSGTLITPAAGAVEYDGLNTFSTGNATHGRGIVISRQMVRINASRTKATNNTSLEAIFDSANDTLSLVTGQLYKFRGVYIMSTSASGTAGGITTGFTFSNAPVSIGYTYKSYTQASSTSQTTGYATATTATTVTATSTSAVAYVVEIEGWFKANATTGGTLIPAFAQSVSGTSAAPTASADTWFEIQAMSATATTTNISGAWT